MIQKYVADMPHCLFYIVGAPQFSTAMEETLTKMGVSKDQCHLDPFTGLRMMSLDAKK